MSIRPMTHGAGYRYLMASVARADEGRAAPPSRLTTPSPARLPDGSSAAGWAGLNDGHGVPVGATVSEAHLWRLLGMLQDPVTGRQLGRAPTN